MAWGGDNPVRHFNPVGSNPGLTNGFDQLESKKSASLDMVLIFGESNAHGPFKHSHNSTYWVLEVPLSGSNNYEHSHASVNMPHVSILATTGLQQTWAFSALVILIVHIIRKFLFKISSWLYRSNTSSKQFKRNTVPLLSTKLFQLTNFVNVSTSHCMKSQILLFQRKDNQYCPPEATKTRKSHSPHTQTYYSFTTSNDRSWCHRDATRPRSVAEASWALPCVKRQGFCLNVSKRPWRKTNRTSVGRWFGFFVVEFPLWIKLITLEVGGSCWFLVDIEVDKSIL